MFKIVTHFLGEVYSLTFIISLTDRSKTNQNEQQHSIYSIHGCDSAIEKLTEIRMRSNKEVQVKVKSQSQLYCQFYHMYRTYIQRIEIALLSYSLVHTDNTKH